MQGKKQDLAFGSRSRAFVVFSFAALAGVWATDAGAVSLRVKLACASDYRALCSQYDSNSEETRSCMRAAGERLSTRCLNALIADGEVTQEEVARRAAQLRQ